MSELLHLAEHRVQELALLFMAAAYTIRLIWLFRWRAGRDRQPPNMRPGTSPRKGSLYSLATIAMPWSMETTRRDPWFYVQFATFHVGVTAGIALSFVIPYAPGWLESGALVRLFQVAIGAAFVVGCIRMVRRVTNPVVRAISTPDDYFSLALLIVWFFLGVLAAPNSTARGEWPLLAYFFMTAFFLVYVPFGKISHYLYYPFSRFYLGRTLGHRGVLPLEPRSVTTDRLMTLRGWPRTGPPRPPRRPDGRDKGLSGRGRVGLSADRTRHAGHEMTSSQASRRSEET